MTKQEITDSLTRSLGRTPTEQEIALAWARHLKARGWKERPPTGKGYIMPMPQPPKPRQD